jgi:hypothetical protein
MSLSALWNRHYGEPFTYDDDDDDGAVGRICINIGIQLTVSF